MTDDEKRWCPRCGDVSTQPESRYFVAFVLELALLMMFGGGGRNSSSSRSFRTIPCPLCGQQTFSSENAYTEFVEWRRGEVRSLIRNAPILIAFLIAVVLLVLFSYRMGSDAAIAIVAGIVGLSPGLLVIWYGRNLPGRTSRRLTVGLGCVLLIGLPIVFLELLKSHSTPLCCQHH
jgi:hypothetical protein